MPLVSCPSIMTVCILKHYTHGWVVCVTSWTKRGQVNGSGTSLTHVSTVLRENILTANRPPPVSEGRHRWVNTMSTVEYGEDVEGDCSESTTLNLYPSHKNVVETCHTESLECRISSGTRSVSRGRTYWCQKQVTDREGRVK